MNCLLYYLSCGYCCGYFGTSSEDAQRRKIKNLNTLNAIKQKSNSRVVWKDIEDPLRVKTNEMTDIYDIPNKQFQTESDVIEYVGYKVGEQIDAGSFGIILTATHLKSKFTIVIKKIIIPEVLDMKSRDKRKGLLRDVKQELFVLSRIRHPYVVKLVHHLMIRSGQRLSLYILMQFAENGNLEKFCEKSGAINEKKSKRWFAQMLSGLSYMHKEGIAHRDLKLSNILLDTALDVLIADFGLSRVVWRKDKAQMLMSSTYCGTPPYMAPEVLLIKTNSYLEYDAFLADIWSLGVVLYVMLCLVFPFPKSTKKALKYMGKKFWRYPTGVSISTGLENLFKLMFEPNPKLRPKTETLQKHKWIEEDFQMVEIYSKQKMKEFNAI